MLAIPPQVWDGAHRHAAPGTAAASAEPQGQACPPRPPLQYKKTRLGLYLLALVLAIGTLVAQLVLMEKHYNKWYMKEPKLVVAAAAIAAALALVLLVYLCHPVVSRSLPGAVTEVALVPLVVVLWLAAAGVTAVTMRKDVFPDDTWPKWTCTAVLVTAGSSAGVWAAVLMLSIASLRHVARACEVARAAATAVGHASPVTGKSTSSTAAPGSGSCPALGKDTICVVTYTHSHVRTKGARLALMSLALLLSIFTLVTQGVLMAIHHNAIVGWYYAKEPYVVIAAASIAAGVAYIILLLLLFPTISASPAVAVLEVTLQPIVVALLLASVGMSAKTAHVFKSWTGTPGRYSKSLSFAVLGLVCASTVLWIVAFVDSFRALLQARACSSQTASQADIGAGCAVHAATEGKLHTPPNSFPTAQGAHVPACRGKSSVGEVPFRWTRVCLYAGALSLAVGTLASQANLMNSQHKYIYAFGFDGDYAYKVPGWLVVQEPGLVVAVSVIAAALALVHLAYLTIPAVSASLAALIAEVSLVPFMVVLWLSAAAVSLRNTVRFWDNKHWAKEWLYSSAAASALASASVVAWIAILVLSSISLKRISRSWSALRAAGRMTAPNGADAA